MKLFDTNTARGGFPTPPPNWQDSFHNVKNSAKDRFGSVDKTLC